MKRLSLFALACLLGLTAQAQDVILRTSGEEVPARVLTIQSDRIAYVQAAHPIDTLLLNTADVFLIRYANGTRELLHTASYAAAPAPNSEQARLQGELDARKYFKARGAFWGTFGATMVSAPVYFAGGLATGTLIASQRPAPHKLTVPDTRLLQNPAYVSGYQKQAQRQKLGKAAAGLGAGVGVSAGLLLVAAVALLNHY
jgi:hypothetical protein